MILKENTSNMNSDLDNNLTKNNLEENNMNNIQEKIFKFPVEEKLIAVLLVCFISGFLDSYTYVLFDKIFANTQTGNLIFLSIHLMEGDFFDALCRLAPILSFSFAIFITHFIIRYFTKEQDTKLVKMVILINITLTIFIGLGFLGTHNYITNEATQFGRSNLAIMSAVCFICGSILSIFRKTGSYIYAPIMFTGNIRAWADAFSKWILNKDKEEFKTFGMYSLLIFVFCSGVSTGLFLVKAFEFKSIYFVTLLFMITYCVIAKDDK